MFGLLPVRLSAGASSWRWTRSWTLHSSGQAGADWEPSAAAGQRKETWAGFGSPPPSSPGGCWRTWVCGCRGCVSRGCGRSSWGVCRVWRRRSQGWRSRYGLIGTVPSLYLDRRWEIAGLQWWGDQTKPFLETETLRTKTKRWKKDS